MNTTAAHPWLPRASCDIGCLDEVVQARRLPVRLRAALRIGLVLLLAPGLPLLGIPLPGSSHLQRAYCRLVLRSLGVRISVSGNPIRNLSGVLVVSSHVSWLDVFAIGAVLPGSFVARADMFSGPAIGVVARILKIIPIERASLRRLPAVVAAVAARLRAGQTVVAFPEGTTWCGAAFGSFYPAMFQAAIDAGRPVQPLRLTYHHVDGRMSTDPAYVGCDPLLRSVYRVVCARRTVARVRVESLQLPGADRRALARRCQTAVRSGAPVNLDHALVA
ncbi:MULTISPECIES: 1-acyl-sn-glycerol-3-phosphate acyltransferase [unclassified Mycobacterium]|uniref:lysophospholipid acyltransferase family protein n=1 Tax=unclassified Mycobacterium TaxID=2642494 RepID=UPI002740E6D2|nr:MULTISPECIES: lysophospholipid acyltransferase family protein [unclassified Mycobacterium]MDP7703030.1 lysophospholipid acyltransferase family protein [Mycobacterium sp. TY815]MDP7721518.1 lysophospholipid acyltransferase family protein [Mycobacterium sp. TY814]